MVKQEKMSGKTEYSRSFKMRLIQLIKIRAGGKNSEFAELVDEPIENITNWTKQKNSVPSADKIKKICEKSVVSAEWLVCGIGKIDPDLGTRWDYRAQVWNSAWYLNPELLDERLPFLYRYVVKKRILHVFKGAALDVTGKKLKDRIFSIYKSWCKACENWIKGVRELEDTKGAIGLNEDITEEKREYIAMLTARNRTIKDQMDDMVKSIYNDLKLFEKD